MNASCALLRVKAKQKGVETRRRQNRLCNSILGGAAKTSENFNNEIQLVKINCCKINDSINEKKNEKINR
jgi:hypothetical protein